MWGPWAPLGPPPLPPRALREGGEEGEAEGLALMRERRLPPPECLGGESVWKLWKATYMMMIMIIIDFTM